jgi:Amino acid transporters
MLAALLVLAVMALHAGKGNGALTLRPVYDPALLEAGKIFSATSICVLSFLGFDAISTLTEETRGDAGKVVGRAILGALAVTTTIFVLEMWVIGNLMPGIQVKDPAAAAFEMADWAIGASFAAFMAWVIALVNGFSNPVPMQAGVARVLFAMGRDRQLPPVLARVHPKYGTPYVSMLVTSALSLAVALAMQDKIEELTSIVNFGALVGFALLHLSVIAHFGLRNKSGKVFLHWVVPLLGLVVVFAVLSGMSEFALQVGLSWLAVGAVYGLVLRARDRDEIKAPF